MTRNRAGLRGLVGSAQFEYSLTDLDVPYFFGDCGMLSVTVADHNRGEMIFGSLELMEWPVMHETKWQEVLCALRCILSRDTLIGR